jgi:hypothetical protein
MRVTVAFLVLLLAAGVHCAIGQQVSDNTFHPTSPSLLVHNGAVPEGYSLEASAAYPAFATGNTDLYGHFTLGLAGVFSATLNHEGEISSPIGDLKPSYTFGLNVQIVPQREQYPSVSLFGNTMLEAQSEYYGSVNLIPKRPDVYNRGATSIVYDAKTTVAGVALASQVGGSLSFAAAIGVKQIAWQQRWSSYAFTTGLPVADGYIMPLPENTTLRLHWSLGGAVHITPQLSVVGELSSLPRVDFNPTTLLLELQNGYVGAFGLSYGLPMPLRVDLYDRWLAPNNAMTSSHQVRLGLSSIIPLQ